MPSNKTGVMGAAGGGPDNAGLWVWGQPNNGKLGLSSGTGYYSPVQMGLETYWATTEGTSESSYAITSDGALFSWGKNTEGQLGLGDATVRSSPVQVGALTNWATVSGMLEGPVLATKTDGTLWAWGENSWGCLGLGDTTKRSSPTQVGSLTNWASVSAGRNMGFAVKTDGTLWSWGGSYAGTNNMALGRGAAATASSPVQVGSLTNWSTVSAQHYRTNALKTDGTAWSWGQGGGGFIGNGATTNQSSPVQVGSLTNWAQVVASGNTANAVKTDGTLWGWGFGLKIGQGSTTAQSSPVQIGSLTNWDTLAPGYNSVFCIKTDGTLWGWGSGTVGMLGQGNTTAYSSPVQVGGLTSWTSVGRTVKHVLAIQE